jgi:hypothetical protein
VAEGGKGAVLLRGGWQRVVQGTGGLATCRNHGCLFSGPLVLLGGLKAGSKQLFIRQVRGGRY